MDRKRLLELAGVPLTEGTSERDFTYDLMQAIEEYHDEEVRSVQSFRDVGMLSNNNGFVVRLNDGSEFQVTVVGG